MSFYVLVFDPEAISDDLFVQWWMLQSEWNEGHDYNDPGVLEESVRSFFDELRVSFPPMNGPLASDLTTGIGAEGDLDDKVTDYSLAPDFVYAAFAWSQAQEAANRVSELAAKHQLAIAWVSSDPLSITRPPGFANGDETVKRGFRWPWSRRSN